jgi:hypothetical protein
MSEQAPNWIMAAPTGHFHTPEGDFVSWGDDDAAVEYIRADLVTPRVKPLKFSERGEHLPDNAILAADCPFGRYYIRS